MKSVFASALLVFSARAWAQDSLASQGPAVKMAPAPVMTVKQGKPVTVPLSFPVASGYHINSNKPKSDFLIPTVLNLESTTDIILGRTAYPEGQDMRFAYAPYENLNVYTRAFKEPQLVRPMHCVQ